MAITQQMVLVRIEDLSPYAEARALVRLVDRILEEAPSLADSKSLLELRLAAVAVAATVAEALRAFGPREEIERLRDASLALADLRLRTWEALTHGEIGAAAFDEVMRASSRCRREVEALEAACRHRARREIELGGGR